LRDPEFNNFRLIVYSHNFTNPKNLAKIGRVDFEIIGLTEIAKKKKQKQKIQPTGLLSAK